MSTLATYTAARAYSRGKATVVGAGLVGLASAYHLAKTGWKVTIVDRRHAVAKECSWGNACLLNPASMLPRNIPLMSLHKHLVFSQPRRRDLYPPPSTYISLQELASSKYMQRFALGYLLKSSSERENFEALKALNSLGTNEIVRIAEKRGGYDIVKGGYLALYSSFEEVKTSLRSFQNYDVNSMRLLDEKHVLELEPSLEFWVSLQKAALKEVYGLWFPSEMTAEPTKFAKILKEMCEEEGVNFQLGCTVSHLDKGEGKIPRIQSLKLADGTVIDSDIFILSAGVFTAELCQSLGLKLPLYPLKGHSITLGEDQAISPIKLGRTFTIAASSINFSPIPGSKSIRVTGFGDFLDYRLGPEGVSSSRLASLIKETINVLPKSLPDIEVDRLMNWIRADQTIAESTSDPIKAWSGLRPFTPDSNPFIGKANGFKNLFLNSGHGSCGWMMSNSSGMLLASLVNNLPPPVNPTPYRVDRFDRFMYL